MDGRQFSVSQEKAHILYRVQESGTEAEVSEHTSFADGWTAGVDATHADSLNAFRLRDRTGRSVARFGFSRLQVRTESLANMALVAI